MPTILVTGTLHPEAIQKLERNDQHKLVYKPECSREELLANVKEAQVLVTRSETKVDQTVIDAAPKLKLIARAAVGVANIDTDYATDRGILVINCPGKNTNSAAELTMALLLAVCRNLPQAHAHVKSGGWDRHRFTGIELRDKSIGIVGLGHVGHRVAQFSHGFDMKVYGYDPYIAASQFEKFEVFRCANLTELATQVDILTVHTPLNKETKGMVSSDVLAQMKPGSIIINAARGGIIDEVALLEALQSKHIRAAGIDTWENEPALLADLMRHEQVWCTPHIGASTVEAQQAIGETVVQQIFKFLDGGVVDHPVNLPQVGVITDPILKIYAVLAEKLGALAGQTLSFNPQTVELHYRGDLAGLDQSLVKLAWMKGYAGQVVDDFVSFVNAESHLDRLGIQVLEQQDPQFSSYKSAIKIVIKGSDGQSLTIGGTVFDSQYARITLINDFYFEIEPSGLFLLIENHDRPGVVGDVGKLLADREINIDSFELSRNKKGGKAMALVRVDSDLSPKDIDLLKKLNNIISVRAIEL